MGLLKILELIPSEIIKFLDPISLLCILAINKHTYEESAFLHRVVASQLYLNDEDVSDLLVARKPNLGERIRYVVQYLDFMVREIICLLTNGSFINLAYMSKTQCLECGTKLDTIFGFFVYKRNKCFDCKKNKVAHYKFDASLSIESDENHHYKGKRVPLINSNQALCLHR